MIGHITKYCSKSVTKILINAIVLSRIYFCGSLFSDLKNIEIKKIDRIIRASIRLIYNINSREHLKTGEHQHYLKLLLFRKQCKHNLGYLLYLAHKYIFLVKPDYLQNQLKRHCILKQNRTSDAIHLEINTLFNKFSNREFSSVIPRI